MDWAVSARPSEKTREEFRKLKTSLEACGIFRMALNGCQKVRLDVQEDLEEDLSLSPIQKAYVDGVLNFVGARLFSIFDSQQVPEDVPKCSIKLFELGFKKPMLGLVQDWLMKDISNLQTKLTNRKLERTSPGSTKRRRTEKLKTQKELETNCLSAS